MSVTVETTSLQDVLLLYPQAHADSRGFFVELWNESAFFQAGLTAAFVQDNFSRSLPGVLRGLHYQVIRPQGKLVRVTRGRALDVAVDLRQDSPTFGQHLAVELSEENGAMLWIPPGFAHGFRVLGSEPVDLLYKCTDFYCPEGEQTIRWDDASLAIDWRLDGSVPVLSGKDRLGCAFNDAPLFSSTDLK